MLRGLLRRFHGRSGNSAPGINPSFLKRNKITDGTMAFHFEKPSGFGSPRQSADLTLLAGIRPLGNHSIYALTKVSSVATLLLHE